VTLRGGVEAGAGVRPRGWDAAVGEPVLAAGARLGARHLALAAAMGHSRLWVRPAPRVVVVTVGDELVEAGRTLRGGRVHDAVGHALVAASRAAGANAVRVGPVGDDRAGLRETLADQMVRADLVVVAGGLSAGPWDTVADVLGQLGQFRLDGVAMSPGGRQGFGTLGEAGGAQDDAPHALVAALPGHPVSALLSFEMVVRPAIRQMAGYTELARPSIRATAAFGWASPAGATQLVPCSAVGSPDEGYVVTALDEPGRVSLSALARANVLAVVGEEVTAVLPGDAVTCLVLEG
jgi:molybdopterin molybdotransferase